MDAPDFRTDKEISMLHAGFEAGLQSDSKEWPDRRQCGRRG
jgi:hypothetical protein